MCKPTRVVSPLLLFFITTLIYSRCKKAKSPEPQAEESIRFSTNITDNSFLPGPTADNDINLISKMPADGIRIDYLSGKNRAE